MIRLLQGLASLKLTLIALLLFAAGISYAYSVDGASTSALAAPLGLLAANLLAAVATNPVFRRQTALLVFHLGLVSIVLLLAAGRLTYLKGQLELSEGEAFDGRLTETDAGPWHPSRLEALRFANEGFSIDYSPGLQRNQTRNRMRYVDIEGVERVTEIGDQTPLVLRGYRFYTSFNKGFAPAFYWHAKDGSAPLLGTVHLPAYPLHEYRQAREWQLPGTAIQAWTMLQFDEIILDPAKPSAFRLPQRHSVVVRIGDLRRELQAGEAIDLPQGRLVYHGLRTWMGYKVFYDWTLSWLLAACLLTVGAMAVHFWRKFAARPWNA